LATMSFSSSQETRVRSYILECHRKVRPDDAKWLHFMR
jgi:hypothetical protein